MKNLNIKNKRIRKAIKKQEQNRFILKTISDNSNLFYLTRWKAFFKLRNLTKNSSKTRMTNRCIVSGRKKRLTKILNVSRLVFLNFARLTEISGIKKAVW
jgi:small subunit ribosomal protein S14